MTRKQNIKCDVSKCKFNDLEKCECNLDSIKVCSCSDCCDCKEETICDSFKKKEKE